MKRPYHRPPAAPAVILALSAALAGAWLAAPSAKAGEGKGQARRPAAGMIEGTVAFAGKVPERTPLVRDTDPVCARTMKLSEEIVVTGGKLADVHVRIKPGTAGKHTPPAEPAEINQRECMYTPRVIGVMEGQKLAIKNSDPTFHNVRGAKEKRTLWNLSQPASAPALLREHSGKAGDVVSLHCDVHPWMQAYAVVTDHPYFAVTGQDGAFVIRGVQPGTYALEAWHPTLGMRTTQVTVRAGQTSKITFGF